MKDIRYIIERIKLRMWYNKLSCPQNLGFECIFLHHKWDKPFLFSLVTNTDISEETKMLFSFITLSLDIKSNIFDKVNGKVSILFLEWLVTAYFLMLLVLKILLQNLQDASNKFFGASAIQPKKIRIYMWIHCICIKYELWRTYNKKFNGWNRTPY